MTGFKKLEDQFAFVMETPDIVKAAFQSNFDSTPSDT